MHLDYIIILPNCVIKFSSILSNRGSDPVKYVQCCPRWPLSLKKPLHTLGIAFLDFLSKGLSKTKFYLNFYTDRNKEVKWSRWFLKTSSPLSKLFSLISIDSRIATSWGTLTSVSFFWHQHHSLLLAFPFCKNFLQKQARHFPFSIALAAFPSFLKQDLLDC